MNSCQNCGHESHCGTRKLRDEYSPRNEFLYQIEVCKSCRCEDCIEKSMKDAMKDFFWRLVENQSKIEPEFRDAYYKNRSEMYMKIDSTNR